LHSNVSMKITMRSAAVMLAIGLLAWSGLQAGAERSRRGGERSARPQQASGRATYGYRAHHHGRHHYPGYGHHFGWYGWYAWPWAWYDPGWPVYVVAEGLAPEAAAAVETDIKPKRAEIWVDGEFVGQARDYNGRWDLLWLKPGRHLFEFRREGYRTLVRELELKPGYHVRVEERLEKGEGSDPRSTRLPPPKVPPAKLQAADPPALARGLLRLVVEPADAAVYLDDAFLARGSELARLRGALPVAVGRHRIEVVRPGYASQRLAVEVEAEGTQTLEIRLEPAP
jgi:hypothetical protein